ncbi:MAG: pyridoxal phosphate-dependent aminotransferase [Gemmatimonadota bacterium]
MKGAFSRFASSVQAETAFTVLSVARRLKSEGKDVIELEIGDSPFPTPLAAAEAGIRAIREGRCNYGPSLGLPEFREAAAEYVSDEYGLDVGPENIVAGPGAKNFEQLFCEAYVDPDDGVLVFTPHFPTYPPNIHRRGARVVLSKLDPARGFRPILDDVRRFLDEDPSPAAIFLNSPNNPSGGVTPMEDLEAIAELVMERDGGGREAGPRESTARSDRRTGQGRGVALFSDEPYDRMVWQGHHHTMLEIPGMIDRTVAAYAFSKSFGMSGWRLGFAVSNRTTVEMLGKLTNTSISCVPPFTQVAGVAALREGRKERDRNMAAFRRKVELLVGGLDEVDGISCAMPGGSFYAFPSVAEVCNRLGITSHGLAMYLLEGADPDRGVACLGGECFGNAGAGFLRLSCAEPDDRLARAVDFIAEAVDRSEAVSRFLAQRPEFRLKGEYRVDALG